MHQNIYYFREQEQTALFEHLSGFLAPGGTLLVTTAVRTGQLSSATLDLWGAMSEGTSRLPVPEELVARMHQAGLHDARACLPSRAGPRRHRSGPGPRLNP